jgi:hypothetical protein
LQKLLKCILFSVLITGLPIAQTADAKTRHHDHRAQTAPAVDQPNPAKAAADLGDPADRTLEKRVRSICRGC